MVNKEPIRVLQVLHVMNRGGAEAMIMNLYRKMDRVKVQFDFLVHSQEEGVFEDEIREMGGRIFRIQPFKGYNVFPYYRECKVFFKVHPEIKVVHGHLGSCAAYYLKAAKEEGMFTIAHSHSTGVIRNFYDLSYKIFSFPTRYVADQLFGCSTEAGIARYGRKMVKNVKYSNFNNAVDSNLFHFSEEQRQLVRRSLNISDDELLIGTVGSITSPKNPKRIFELFRYLVLNNSNVKCLWVGTGEMESYYRGLIKVEGLDNRIIMTGVRSDISEIMHALDCMLFPSLWEGLPVSVIESQAANLPTVLADTISREVQISDLLCWHNLDEDNAVWAADVMRLAQTYRGHRDKYSFDMSATGYDINETVRWLMNFYEKNAK